MPRYSDDLYLGNATGTPDDPSYPASGRGVGPLGRIYLFDTVPLALNTSNIAAAQTPAGAGALTLTAGTGVTSAVNARGETVLVFDVPRAGSVSLVGGGTPRTYTWVGYDVNGVKMSEDIISVAAATVNGKKAFKSVLSITGAGGGSTTAITCGSTDILGLPFRVTDRGYVVPRWNNTLAQDAGTLVVADATDPATATTGDVRGTYVPSSATDGVKRLIAYIGLPALASGPNATRLGAMGVLQNLYAS